MNTNNEQKVKWNVRENIFNLSDSVKIYYRLHGTGRNKVIFLNGSGVTEKMWEPWAEHLLATEEGDAEFELLTFDYRGSGKSEAPLMTQTTTMLAVDGIKLMNHIGWKDQKVHVFGASMGGLVAEELAYGLTKLGRPPASLFLSVTARRMSPIQIPFGSGFYKYTLAKFMANKPRADIIKFIVENCNDEEFLNSRRVDNNKKNIWKTEEQCAEEAAKYGELTEREIMLTEIDTVWNESMTWNVNTLAAQYCACFGHLFQIDRCNELRKFQIPTMIQISKHDKIINPKQQYELARLLGAKTLELDCGHLAPHYFFPQIVQAFLENIKPANLNDGNNNNDNNNNDNI